MDGKFRLVGLSSDNKIRLFSFQRLLSRRAFCETRVSHDTHTIMHACHETSEEIIIWKNEAYEMKQSLKSSRLFKYVASRQHRLFKQLDNKRVNSCRCFESFSLLLTVVWQVMKSGMCKLNLHMLRNAGSHSGYQGALATTTATATRTSKSNRFILAKQQLCTCITLFCTFFDRPPT